MSTDTGVVAEPTPFIPDTPPEPTPPIVPAEFAPVTKADRLVNLDFVRGVALLGILLVNVASFFGPFAALMGGRNYVSNLPLVDQIPVLFVTVLVAGKFISQFSMMFGYGLLGQVERAYAAATGWARSLPRFDDKFGDISRGDGTAIVAPSPVSETAPAASLAVEAPDTEPHSLSRSGAANWPGWFAVRRLGVLAAFGAVHALAFWYGDVLFLYATLGVFVTLWRGNTAGSLLIIAGVLLGIMVALGGVGLAAELAFGGRGAPPTPPAVPGEQPLGWRAMVAAQGNPGAPVWKEAETIAYRDGPWFDAQTFRTAGWLFVVLSTYIVGWVHIVGMFALGAWMWRKKFFAPEQEGLRKRVMTIFLPLGLFFAVLATGFYVASLNTGERALWAAGSFCASSLAVVTLPLGYVAGLAMLADRLPTVITTTVASAGRMALTVYLSETLIATFLSYHWGLRWFGITPWQQFVTALVIWASLVLLARLYLTFFNQGPMEWLWRRLEYGRR